MVRQMSRWFRMYDEILDDPKVQKLPPALFRMWVNALALCSRNGGKLPAVEDIAFALRETQESVSSAFHTLTELGLCVTDGETFQPKNWKKRQYKSDTSTDRVREYRKRSRNGDETSSDTETDTETEKNKITPQSGFAFIGKVIRLKTADFNKWHRAYPSLDLLACLQSRDDWLATEADEKTRKKWFLSTSNHLANLQQRARSQSYDRDRITV